MKALFLFDDKVAAVLSTHTRQYIKERSQGDSEFILRLARILSERVDRQAHIIT